MRWLVPVLHGLRIIILMLRQQGLALIYLDIIVWDLVMKKDQRGLSTAWSEQTLLSYIARVNYNYAGKYLLTATARYDGSSKFAKGNSVGYFSVCVCSLEYYRRKVHEKVRRFLIQLKYVLVLVSLVIRILMILAYLSLYNVSYTGTSDTGYTNFFCFPMGDVVLQILVGRNKNQWNLGVDMAFLQNRVRLSVDAFLIKK